MLIKSLQGQPYRVLSPSVLQHAKFPFNIVFTGVNWHVYQTGVEEHYITNSRDDAIAKLNRAVAASLTGGTLVPR